MVWWKEGRRRRGKKKGEERQCRGVWDEERRRRFVREWKCKI